MHRPDTVQRALDLSAAGLSANEVARRLGVSRTTVGNWLRGQTPRGRPVAEPIIVPEAYAYLLGLYLGDGHIARWGRNWVLRLALDAAYPVIVVLAADAVATTCPHNKVMIGRHKTDQLFTVRCTSAAWPQLFPQHGRGRKHERPIRLEPWQEQITHAYPRELIRGLIHSDGCRFVARQRVGEKVYKYSRYSFSNRSEDIKDIFTDHLDLLGIGWTWPNAHQIAVDRRAEVAKLDAFVGPKR